MAKNDKRVQVTLECTTCKRRNYITDEEQDQRPRAHRDEEVLPLGPARTPSTRRPGRRADVTPWRPSRGGLNRSMPSGELADLVARGQGGRPAGLRRAGASRPTPTPTRSPPAHRRRGGRAGRGAGGLPAGLPGARTFRGDAQFTTWLYRITANCAATHLGRRARHRHDELDDDTALGRRAPRARPAGPADAGRPARPRPGARSPSCRPGCGPSSCSATSTTCPTRRSPPSSGISESAAKVRLHRARRKLRGALFPGRRGRRRRGARRRAV